MKRITIGILALAVVAGAGVWIYMRGLTPAALPTDETTYAVVNVAYGYVFRYPVSWVLEPETKVVDLINDIPSVVTVHEAASTSPHRFGVTINKAERTIKHEALASTTVAIDNVEAVAYFFPDGLGCTPSEQDPDCSFFLIPIHRNGVWYEITAANDAQTLDAYRPILDSFRFTH